jgi:hypothetical protein
LGLDDRAMRVSDDLRTAWLSLQEAEGDEPGHDYDRGYLTGWHDGRRHIRRRLPRGRFRDAERIVEFRLGYVHGKEDGEGRATDWWPDRALGRLGPDGEAIPGSGEPVRLRLVSNRLAYRQSGGLVAPVDPEAVKRPISTSTSPLDGLVEPTRGATSALTPAQHPPPPLTVARLLSDRVHLCLGHGRVTRNVSVCPSLRPSNPAPWRTTHER